MEAWNRFRGFTTRAPKPFENLATFALPPLILPVFEEWLFRGVMLRGLLQRYRPAVAVALTSLLHAVAHADTGGVVVAFSSSIVWGWWYVRTRSLGLCILGHVFQNATTMALLMRFGNSSDNTPLPALAAWGGLVFLMGMVVCLLGFGEDKEEAVPKRRERRNSGKKHVAAPIVGAAW